MKFLYVFLLAVSAGSFVANAQTRTISGSGNWSNSGNWAGGNIGGDVDNDDDVVMNNNIDITIQNAETYTIATLDVSKDGSLTIDLGGFLTVTGTVTVDKDFTINIDGDLIVEGNLDVAKSLQLNVTGNLTVKGDVTAAKDAQLDVQGTVDIEGDFTSAKDAQVNVDGTLDVTGDLNLGGGSVITGVGVVTAGSCSGAACGDSQVLPVELLFFDAQTVNKSVVINWATASEENFDYFSIERSGNGEEFREIAQINGSGTSTSRIDYQYVDNFPLNGKSYYRLRSIDFDGYTELFDIVLIDVEGFFNDFRVFPNPVVDYKFTIQTNFIIEEESHLYIYNNAGILEKEVLVSGWQTEYEIDGLERGLYLFKLVTKKDTMIHRILLN